ncbi:MAG: flagellar hook protein FlgE, partial [Kangiellaceae bacterium]|nr:flagellar hook protein FlgE [Kangiellaceae bacterium]
MSFNTSLSGLNAAQADLGVISQDIANVATVGYKESRAEFGDIMATSALGSGSTAIGSGVLLNNVSQQFHQGNTNFTSNSLDMAITGEGFFVTTPGTDSSDFVYTRAGQFGVDADGNVVNSTGGVLRAFQTNADGTVTSTSLDTTIPLRLPTTSGSPQQTSEVELSLNLDARTGVNFAPPLDRDGVNGAALAFDAADSSTYTRSTSVKIYDSLGQSHIQTLFFTKLPPNPAAAAGAADEDTLWEVRMQVDGQDV